jgi:hypothetical protein
LLNPLPDLKHGDRKAPKGPLKKDKYVSCSG